MWNENIYSNATGLQIKVQELKSRHEGRRRDEDSIVVSDTQIMW